MRMLRYALAALVLCLLPISAQAADCGVAGANNCYFVATTTGSWSSTSNWSDTSNGTTGVGPPVSQNLIVFDSHSGTGQITCDVTSPVFASLITSLFTGTLCNATDNFNPTFSVFADAATGVHTINMGVGTWTTTTIGPGSAGWAITAGANLTLNANSSTLLFAPLSTQTGALGFTGGSHSYNIVMVGGANSAGNGIVFSGNNTIATLIITAPENIYLPASSTQTITNAPSWVGTAASPILIYGANGTIPNLIFSASGGTAQWTIFNHVNGETNTLTASNSFGLGVTGTISISNPSGGGGGSHCIGC